MLLILDPNRQSGGGMAHIYLKLFVPFRVEAVGDVPGLEEASGAQVGGDVGVGQIAGVNVEERGVRIRQVFGFYHVDDEPTVEKLKLGFAVDQVLLVL